MKKNENTDKDFVVKAVKRAARSMRPPPPKVHKDKRRYDRRKEKSVRNPDAFLLHFPKRKKYFSRAA